MSSRPPKRIAVPVPKFRSQTKVPTGPRMYRQPAKPVIEGGPGEPPAGFLDPHYHGSRSEWPIYWGLWKALDVYGNPRYPPYDGAPDGSFGYQKAELGGRRQLGGAVADFIVYPPPTGQILLIRVQTQFFHLQGGPQTVSSDELQRLALGRENNVIDVYDRDFLHLDGKALVVYVKRVLGLIQSVNPLTAGLSTRIAGY